MYYFNWAFKIRLEVNTYEMGENIGRVATQCRTVSVSRYYKYRLRGVGWSTKLK